MSSKFVQRPRTQPLPAICKKGWPRRSDSSWPRRLLCNVQLLDWMPAGGNPNWIDVFTLQAIAGPPTIAFDGFDQSLWANLHVTYVQDADGIYWHFALTAFNSEHPSRTYTYHVIAADAARCQFGPIEIDSGEPFHAKAIVKISF